MSGYLPSRDHERSGDNFISDGSASRVRGAREEQFQPTPVQFDRTPSYSTSDSYPFFLLGEGISRDVIQTDLPRYLGNNAQCKPSQDKFGRPGFLYKGFRPLTDAQIHTLREDSARWKAERQRYSEQSGGRRGPDYVDSRTFHFSYKNYVTVQEPNGGMHARPLEPAVRPPIPAPEHPIHQEQQFRYMPSPDNRPWYDNWSRQYVHPFREPGAKSPEPPAQDSTPRYMDPPEPSTTIPIPEFPNGPPIPLNSVTGMPILGHWKQDEDGEWMFRTIGDPTRPL